MRTLLLCAALLGLSYTGLAATSVIAPGDRAYRMAELDAPVTAGRVIETSRPDLFVPLTGAVDYSVPATLAQQVTTQVTDGRRWHLYTPKKGAHATATILLFHGAGRDGLSVIDMWRTVADAENLRLVALDGKDRNWPADHVAPTILHRILDTATGPDPARTHPVYLFGHSNGGAYVQRLLNQTDGPWRAATSHAGFADPARGITPADAKPLHYIIGTRDHIFRPDTARVVAHQLAERGHDVDLHVVPDHTHWFYTAGPVIAAEAWHWLSRH